MLETLSRDEFLQLVALKSDAFDQRQLMGQTAFAFGCRKPAHVGEYLLLDGLAMGLVGMLNAQGLKLEDAADVVLRFWKEWLTLVAKAEREEQPPLFFAVAVQSPGPGGTYDSSLPRRVAFGNANQIVETLYRADESYGVAMIPVHGLLRQLRKNAKLAKPKIVLPERFTIADDEPGYENWWAEIRAYRERAEARFQAKTKKAKAKGRRAARAPARIKPLMTVK
jgi:hypothetical protein